MLRILLAPATAFFIRRRNSVKMPIIALLYTVPIALAAGLQPFEWLSWPAAFVAAGYLFAIYCSAAHYYSSDEAWKMVRAMATLLNERDLRSGGVFLSRDEARRRLGSGQFGELYGTLADAHENLRTLVLQAHASAAAARHAADALARGNVELSRRSEEQASTLEESAAAMEQLSSTVKENADSCREASQVAAGATTVARDGAKVAQEAIATMDLVDRSSRKVVDIIAVIESIAFQTNILALNAAVEAARAGEQGRGFAVVASEVRSLAQRSAQAAKEIKGLIEASVGSVDEGARLVKDAGRIIGEVADGVEQLNELIGIVAVASREQASGVESVNKALAQLQSATGHTAGIVQEAAFSAVTLKEEAGRLFDLVAQFRTDPLTSPEALAAAPTEASRRAVPPAARTGAKHLANPRKSPALTAGIKG